MNKIFAYVVFIFISTIVASTYGVIHDQISYTLSEEYFTKFKFLQFNLPWAYAQPRIGAACVGALASWWMGTILSSLLGVYGFFFPNWQKMLSALIEALVVVIFVSVLSGVLGLAYGYLKINADTYVMYENYVWGGVTNPVQFLRVGFMHNSSYVGGFTGFLFGVVYLHFAKKKL